MAGSFPIFERRLLPLSASGEIFNFYITFMNRFTLLSAFFILLFSISATADDSGETTLRLNLKKGSRYEIVSNSKMDYFTDASLSEKVLNMDWNVAISMEVMDKTAEGVHTIKAEITRINANQSAGGMTMSYDSENASEDDPMAAMLAQQFDPLIKHPITLTVDQLGKIIEVAGEEKEGGMVSLSSIAQNFFMELPENPVEEGDKWQQEQEIEMSNTKINLDYSTVKISGNTVELAYHADEKSITTEAKELDGFQIKLKGNSTFDKKTGMMVSATQNTTMKGSDPQMGEFFMVTTTDQSAKLK